MGQNVKWAVIAPPWGRFEKFRAEVLDWHPGNVCAQFGSERANSDWDSLHTNCEDTHKLPCYSATMRAIGMSYMGRCVMTQGIQGNYNLKFPTYGSRVTGQNVKWAVIAPPWGRFEKFEAEVLDWHPGNVCAQFGSDRANGDWDSLYTKLGGRTHGRTHTRTDGGKNIVSPCLRLVETIKNKQ